MPLFSVIIPVYNRAHFVSAAIESVLGQTCDDFELIVVDDGSTDDTRAVVTRYEPRVQLLAEPHRGAPAARNAGIRKAHGRYVTFLDSDDIWFPWSLSTFERVIQDHRGPSFIAGTRVSFRDTDPLVGEHLESAKWEHFPNYLAAWRKNVWMGTPGVAVQRSVLWAQGGFTDRDTNAEDLDLWLRLGLAGGFVFVHTPPVFARRLHDGNLVNDADRSCDGVAFLLEQERSGRYPGTGRQAWARRQILTRYVRSASLDQLWKGNVAQGWRLYWAALRWQLQLFRIKYVIGWPVAALGALVRKNLRWSEARPPAGDHSPLDATVDIATKSCRDRQGGGGHHAGDSGG